MITVYFQEMLGPGEPRKPTKAYLTDAGWDLHVSRPVLLAPDSVANIHTDIAMAMPEGWCALIRPRSSTVFKRKLWVMEGVIDHTYRGELFFSVKNTGGEIAVIEVGQRLAQLIFVPVPEVNWKILTELPDSARGQSGFGSTGK